jgi:hypothetical protein
VNCTKLMYVAMILLLQLIIGSFLADEIKRTLRPAIRGSNADRNTRRLCATCNRSLIAAFAHQTLRLRIGRVVSPNRPQTSHCLVPVKKCRSKDRAGKLQNHGIRCAELGKAKRFSLQPSLRASHDSYLWPYRVRSKRYNHPDERSECDRDRLS